ncbi:MAG: hypothetical protein ACT4NP_17710 [Pseudonocardiales bacterium]
MIGLRRRPCRIHIRASYWLLRQPDEALLLSHLAGELEQGTAPAPGAASPPDRSSLTMTAGIDPSDTDVLSRVMGDPRGDPSQTPAVSPRFLPADSAGRDGRTKITVVGPGDDPEGLRPRRVPPDKPPPPHSGRSLLLAGGMT